MLCCCTAHEDTELAFASVTGAELDDVNSVGSPRHDFTMYVQRQEGRTLGLDIDWLDGVTGQVCGVRQDFAKAYNDELPEEQRLAVGDFVVSVNGASRDAAELLRQMQSSTELLLGVKRSREIRVKLEKGSGLGLQLQHTVSSVSLLVQDVAEGSVLAWNARHEGGAAEQVRVRDRIMSVNGVRGDAEAILECLKSATSVDMTIVRSGCG